MASLFTTAQATLPIQVWQLDNGARVFFIEARGIPMVDIRVDFDAGNRLNPPQRTALASLTSYLLKSGTTGKDEKTIADLLADTGADLNPSVDADRAGLSLRTLSSNTELKIAVDLLAELIQRPSFPNEILEREKTRTIAEIRESETKPETIARKAFVQAMFGTHPYGHTPIIAEVEAITRAELVDFHRRYYVGSTAVLAMIGDISRGEAKLIAQNLLGSLPRGEKAPPYPPAGVVDNAPKRISHPSAQAHIWMGQPAIKRGDPDYFPLLVGNYILGGGGFSSRLTKEIREKRGLVYSIYSHFAPAKDPGAFQIGLQTKKEQADAASLLVKNIVIDYIRTGPSATELKAAKANLIGGFSLRIDSNKKLLENMAAIGYYQLPIDYLDTWTDRVASVSLEQIRSSFTRWVKPDNMAFVMVGAPADNQNKQ